VNNKILVICSLLILGILMTIKNESKAESIIKIKGVKFIKSFGAIDEYQLDNGLKILLKANKNVPLFSWQVWYKVGSRNESAGLTGIAHYLEHIMFKGTQNLRKGEIAQLIQLQGGIFNAFTSDDYTAYYENFSPDNLELAIKIEADRMQNSRLNNEEIELERSVIVSELEGNRNDPYNLIYETLRSNAFDVHSYRNPVIGWRKDLDNINAQNMREFYERFYYPDNATAILVGNFDTELALTLISKYFGKYNKRRDASPQLIAVEPEQKAEKRVTIYNDGAVKLLGIGFHIPEFDHKDTIPLHLLSGILFDGMSSRLYPKLVDAGLVTGFSGLPESSLDPGFFRIIINVNNDVDISQVENIIYTELDSIKNTISEEELKIAKAKEESSYVYQKDGVHEEGLQIGYFNAISNDWTKYITWIDTVKSVTADDIKRVANQYFINSNKTVVHLLPGEAPKTLSETAFHNPSKLAYYGAGTLEPINPEQLSRLVAIAEPKISKKNKFTTAKFDFQTFNLDNGNIQVLIREDHSLPLTYINVQFYAGSAAEGDRQGLAFLTSQLLETGSKSMDKYQIAKLTDLYGSDISFSSGIETAKISISSISQNLEATLEILKDIIQNPSFSEKELDILKMQSKSRLRQEDDFLSKISKREISQLIYPPNHPYQISNVETREKSISSITVDDIKKFYRDNYNARNLLVSIVGDIEIDKAQSLLTNVFSAWNMNGTELANNKPDIPNATIEDAKQKIIVKDEKEQVEIVLAHASFVNRHHKDFYPLLIANYALGGSPLSSRLGSVVRDEFGYVYNIRSGFSATLGAGMFSIGLGCNPSNVSKAISLTKKITEDFLREGVNATELKVASSYLKGSFAVRTLASNEDISETLSQIQLYDLGLDYVDSYQEMIDSITLDQVNDSARKYIIPDKLNTVIVGPSSQ
jgi:zinc protease